ncbi:MAG: hypothetical protein C0582_05170 [Alphaproteobacteria bacterium]|nr:MAG: hypothetical protein C0582_05170 [Alphaproteobacteria bacterium]
MKKDVVGVESHFMSDAGINPFDLFDLPLTLPVDSEKLKNTYFELQRQNHPDQKQSLATGEINAGLINRYYTEMKKTSNAARYLLLHYGIEGDASTQDQETLMEVMELEERLAQQPTDKAGVLADINVRMNQTVSAFLDALSEKGNKEIEKDVLLELWQRLRFLDQLIERCS